MQILEQVDDLSDVEYTCLFCKLSEVGFDEVDELSTLTILLHEVERLLVLEGIS